jgi:hypothetical protein
MEKELLRSLRYREAQTETEAAYAKYNAAARALDIAHIQERNAELGSQCFESVAKGKLHERLGAINAREREIGLAFARYATYGRCDEA